MLRNVYRMFGVSSLMRQKLVTAMWNSVRAAKHVETNSTFLIRFAALAESTGSDL